jgi:Lrp/AsnC family transcriptional regulator, regulator for asnA, asnC and gidA
MTPEIAKDSQSEPTPLDDLDRQVIAALQADGRKPYSRIASELGLSESVVRYRAQRLERAGVLQVVGIADPLKIGFDLMAMVGVKIRPGALDPVCDAIAALPEASYVAATAGGYDALVEVVCRDTAHFGELLTRRLQTIDGVTAAESFLILDIRKMAYGWGVGQVAVAPGGSPARAGAAAKETTS